MSRSTRGSPHPSIESLEDRRYFSAEVLEVDSAYVLQHQAGPAAPAVFGQVLASTSSVVNVVGRYSGRIYLTLPVTENFFVRVKVIEQTANRIRGTIFIAGVGSSPFVLRGRVGSTGYFTASFDDPEASGTLTGRIQTDGDIKGQFSGNFGVTPVAGRFNLNKYA